jgi:SH3-like domain-containing protein
MVIALVCAATSAHAEKCKSKNGRPMVLVKDRVSIRRGPGLNYPVSSFLTEGKCVSLNETSTDEMWVLIEDDASKTFGWVAAKDIDNASREALPKGKSKGPIGSGQERGFVATKSSASLLARPEVKAEVKKVLPPGSRLLALAMTEDERWVEVRDDRGDRGWVGARGLRDESDTLAGLPRTSSGLKTGIEGGGNDKGAVSKSSQRDIVSDPVASADRDADKSDPPPQQQRSTAAPDVEERVTPSVPLEKKGLSISAEVLGTFALPRHGFDSNGAAGFRRYKVEASAAGGHIEAFAEPLGPLRARLAYDFVLLTGLSPSSGNSSVSGQEHAAEIMFGFPIQLSSVMKLVPELGYSLDLFAMQPSLAGVTASPVVFFSSHSHAATLGLVATIAISEYVGLDANAAGMVGTTIVYPETVGSAGLMTGGRVGVGLHFGIGGGSMLLARWDSLYLHTPFTGKAAVDPTITSASITHLQNSFSAGILIAF